MLPSGPSAVVSPRRGYPKYTFERRNNSSPAGYDTIPVPVPRYPSAIGSPQFGSPTPLYDDLADPLARSTSEESEGRYGGSAYRRPTPSPAFAVASAPPSTRQQQPLPPDERDEEIRRLRQQLDDANAENHRLQWDVREEVDQVKRRVAKELEEAASKQQQLRRENEELQSQLRHSETRLQERTAELERSTDNLTGTLRRLQNVPGSPLGSSQVEDALVVAERVDSHVPRLLGQLREKAQQLTELERQGRDRDQQLADVNRMLHESDLALVRLRAALEREVDRNAALSRCMEQFARALKDEEGRSRDGQRLSGLLQNLRSELDTTLRQADSDRRLRDLELSQTRQRLAESAGQEQIAEELRREVQGLKDRLAERERDLARSAANTQELESQLRIALQQRENEAKQLQRQLGDTERLASDYRNEGARLATELKGAELAVERKQGELVTAVQALRGASDQIGQLSQSLHHEKLHSLEASRVEGILESKHAELARLKQQLDRIAQQLRNAEHGEQEAEKAVARLVPHAAALEQERDSLAADLQREKQAVLSLKNELHSQALAHQKALAQRDAAVAQVQKEMQGLQERLRHEEAQGERREADLRLERDGKADRQREVAYLNGVLEQKALEVAELQRQLHSKEDQALTLARVSGAYQSESDENRALQQQVKELMDRIRHEEQRSARLEQLQGRVAGQEKVIQQQLVQQEELRAQLKQAEKYAREQSAKAVGMETAKVEAEALITQQQRQIGELKQGVDQALQLAKKEAERLMGLLRDKDDEIQEVRQQLQAGRQENALQTEELARVEGRLKATQQAVTEKEEEVARQHQRLANAQQELQRLGRQLDEEKGRAREASRLAGTLESKEQEVARLEQQFQRLATLLQEEQTALREKDAELARSKAQATKLEEEANMLGGEVREAKVALEAAHRELTSEQLRCRAELTAKDKAVQQLRAEVQTAQEDVMALRREKAGLETTLRAEQERNGGLKREVTRGLEEVEERERQVQELQAKLEALEQQHREISRLSGALEGTQGTVERLASEVEQLTHQLRMAEGELKEREAQLHSLASTNAGLEQEANTQRQERKKADGKLADALRANHNQVEALRQDVEDKTKQVETLKEQLANLHREHGVIRAEKSNLQLDLAAAQRNGSELAKAHEALSAQLKDVRQRMEQQREDLGVDAEVLRTRLAAEERARAAAQKELDMALLQVAGLQSDVRVASEQAMENDGRATRLEETLREREEELKHWKRRLEEAEEERQRLVVAEEQAALREEQVNLLSQQVDALRAALAAAEAAGYDKDAEGARQRGRVREAEGEAERLRQQLVQCQTDLEALRRELGDANDRYTAALTKKDDYIKSYAAQIRSLEDSCRRLRTDNVRLQQPPPSAPLPADTLDQLERLSVLGKRMEEVERTMRMVSDGQSGEVQRLGQLLTSIDTASELGANVKLLQDTVQQCKAVLDESTSPSRGKSLLGSPTAAALL